MLTPFQTARLVVFAAAALATAGVTAAPITYNLANNGDINDIDSLQLTLVDITKSSLTFTLFNPEGDDEGDWFGNNNVGVGIGDDRFEAGESFSFRFDQDVYIQQIVGLSTATISSTAFVSPIDLDSTSDFVPNLLLPANTAVNVTRDTTTIVNRFASITVEVVPEPASLALIGAAGLCLLPRRRDRAKV